MAADPPSHTTEEDVADAYEQEQALWRNLYDTERSPIWYSAELARARGFAAMVTRRAIDIVAKEGLPIIEAIQVARSWHYTNSAYSWIELDLRYGLAGDEIVDPRFARLLAACHVLTHRGTLRDALAAGNEARLWRELHWITRHGGTILRADQVLSVEGDQSEKGRELADARWGWTRALKLKAVDLFQAGGYTKAAVAARDIHPELERLCLEHERETGETAERVSLETVRDWLRKHIQSVRKATSEK